MNRDRVPTGSPWGDIVGYSRAVRVGDQVFVAGTTAAGPDGSVAHPGDAGAQTTAILGHIAAALTRLGAAVEDVVETRIYVTDIAQWEAVGRAHGAVFGAVRPASTMVEVSRLLTPEMLVEISATAIIRRG